jgi:hypothetical protein
MASTGAGTAVHLSGELFKVMTGVDMVHVLIGAAHLRCRTDQRQVQVLFSDVPVRCRCTSGKRARRSR